LKRNIQKIVFETIVVDNNSVDGSPEFLRENFPWIQLVRNNENFGYSKANNQGINETTGEFILFLNPDTQIFPGAIDLILEEMKTSPLVGALGPALVSEKSRYQVSFGKKINFAYEFLQKCLFNLYFRYKLKRMQQKYEVGWLSGACFLTRRSVLEETGFFDENFFLYFEDIDLCRRIKKTGRKLIFLPRAKVLHVEGATTSLQSLSSLYFYRQSQLYFYRKHTSKVSIFLLRVYLSINFVFLFISGYFKSGNDRRFIRRFFRLLRKR
jgi:GT2 family glycosyltransferase